MRNVSVCVACTAIISMTNEANRLAKILLVDDDEIMVAALAGLLEAEKHRVECISDGLEALEHLKSFDYDVVVLDWQLPSMEGIDVCQKYRASGGKNFIIMLTGQSDTEHKEKGLDTGADDYLTKPFDTRELLARIRVCLRRPSEFHGEVLKFGPLECDLKARSLSINSTEIKLSPLEFSVLEFFVRQRNEV